MNDTMILARLAAANAACIAREIPACGSFAHHLHDIDLVAAAAVRMAEVEVANPGVWDAVNWEEACAQVAQRLSATGREFTDTELATVLGLTETALRELPVCVT
jgi:hypothetical protein